MESPGPNGFRSEQPGHTVSWPLVAGQPVLKRLRVVKPQASGSVLSSSSQVMATYRPRRTFERGLVVNHILDKDGRTDYARKSEDGNTRKE